VVMVVITVVEIMYITVMVDMGVIMEEVDTGMAEITEEIMEEIMSMIDEVVAV